MITGTVIFENRLGNLGGFYTGRFFQDSNTGWIRIYKDGETFNIPPSSIRYFTEKDSPF